MEATKKKAAAVVFAAGIAAGAALGLWARQAADATPTSDIAVIEIYTLLASQGDLLLGPYSRFQWHHPGPLYFFWMAPFYALSGLRTTGLNAGALALNLLSVSLIAWVLARRAPGVVAIATCTALALYAWRAAELLTSPWNPHVPVLPMTALVVLAADAVSGTPAVLPLVGVIASLSGQTHIALLPSAAGVGVCTLAAVLLRPRNARRKDRREGRGVVWIALGTVAAVAASWAPTVIEQLTSRPGNVSLLWSFFVTETRPTPSFFTAVSAWSDMLSGLVRPDFYVAHGWLFRESPVNWAELLVVAQLVALFIFAARGYRSGRRFEAALAVILALASLVALASAMRVDGEIFDHGVFWMSGLGVLNSALLASLVVRTLTAREPPVRASAVACGLLVLVAAAVGTRGMRHAIAGAALPPADSKTAAMAAADLITYMKAERLSRPLVKLDQDAWGVAAGVILRLQKSQVPVAIEDDWIVMFTPAFAATGKESDVLTIAGRAQHVRMLDTPGDATVVSRDPIYVHRAGPGGSRR